MNKAESIDQINALALKQRLDDGESLLLLDVRSPFEFEYDGHIEGARLLPLPAMLQRIDELPKDQTIVCICRSGNRSQSACEQLKKRGYDRIINLSGGMIGWRQYGLPID